MLSVLLLGFGRAGSNAATPGETVRTLAALVPASVDGVVRDLCLAGPEEPYLRQIADHAGCTYVAVANVTEALAKGSQQLRSTHVLVAHAGIVIDRAVIDELASLLPLFGEAGLAAWVLKADGTGFLSRSLRALAPVAAVICSRTWLAAAGASSLPALAARAKDRRILKSRALLGA